jgi:hypothetical protein
MQVRMLLVGVQHHCITVLEPEILQREPPSAGETLSGGVGDGIERTML